MEEAMSEELIKAIKMARIAHGDTLDKKGELYFLHPLMVMAAMDTEEEMIVAILHDVVEDTYVTLIDIWVAFDLTIEKAVDSVTKRPGKETYFEFVKRSKANPIGRKVKIADIRENISKRREIPESKSMRPRYLKALALLLKE